MKLIQASAGKKTLPARGLHHAGRTARICRRITRAQQPQLTAPHTVAPRATDADVVCPGPLRIPAPNPTSAPNRCSLKPLTPATPEKTLLLVWPARRLTPQVVYRRLPPLQFPKPFSQTRLPTQDRT